MWKIFKSKKRILREQLAAIDKQEVEQKAIQMASKIRADIRLMFSRLDERVITPKNEKLASKIRLVWLLLDLNYKAKYCTYNPIDIYERYDSLGEKRKALEDEYEHFYTEAKDNKGKLNFWKGISIDSFFEVANKNLTDYEYKSLWDVYDEDIMLKIGFVR